MTSIELKTSRGGEAADLIIDGENVSRKVTGVTIRFSVHDQPRATVSVDYRTDQLEVAGDFEESQLENSE